MKKTIPINENDVGITIRELLNHNLTTIPEQTLDHLKNARHLALKNRKTSHLKNRFFIFSHPFANTRGFSFFAKPTFGLNAFTSLLFLISVVFFVTAFFGFHQYSEQQHLPHLSTIDQEMLSDTLPLDAYTDHGFKTYLLKPSQPLITSP